MKISIELSLIETIQRELRSAYDRGDWEAVDLIARAMQRFVALRSAQPEPLEDGDEVLADAECWVLDSGTRYHRFCDPGDSRARWVTVAEAEEEGYSYCGSCKREESRQLSLVASVA